MAPSRRTRKRKSQPQSTYQNEDGESEIDGATAEENAEDHGSEGSDNEEAKGERVVDLEKEREIWEVIKEDHFEVFDQLPLTLHRQYTLLKELEQQSSGFMNDLLPTVKRYIALRKSLDAQIKIEQVAQAQQLQGTEPGHPIVIPKDGEDVPMDIDATPTAPTPDNPNPPSNIYPKHTTPPPAKATSTASFATPPPTTASTTTAPVFPRTPIRAIPPHMSSFDMRTPIRTPTPTSVPHERLKVPETSREMLSHMAWLTEEMVRTANEKVHLAQAAHDTLERQIRVLGQSIKEQEMALSLGARPGTQLAPILLPEVIVPLPRWTKPVTNASAVDSDDELPIGGLYGNNPGASEETPTLGIVDENPTTFTQSTLSRRRTRKKKPGNKKNQENGEVKRPLTITLPPADSEKKYCYCNRVSFGEMVGCDAGESCAIEWFHLDCVGLTELPSEDQAWYCRDCEPKVTSQRRRRR
ncbi:hypothetical protein L218DRAFT_895844 [Marasmius fiardii PR-910]|nr:hypothetical protein L218DRAFT_895844 [Marasmius fiardii PR-910]